MTLSISEINERLPQLPEWSLEGSTIQRTFQFSSFPDTITFVNKVAELAEQANHHPDIDIRYTAVKLTLTTHSAKGLTDKDFMLAQQIDANV